MRQLQRLIWWLKLTPTRLRARWRIITNHAHHLNTRVDVERVLLDVSNGRRGTLTKDECRELAYKLGVPLR